MLNNMLLLYQLLLDTSGLAIGNWYVFIYMHLLRIDAFIVFSRFGGISMGTNKGVWIEVLS